jgi:carbamate kinase
MGPKIEAAVKFVEGGGKRAIIAALQDGPRALAGEAGTEIVA